MTNMLDPNHPAYVSLMQKLRDYQHNPHPVEIHEPTPDAWCVSPDLIGVDTEDGPRFLRASLVESVSPHQDGAIIKTQSGDFHKVEASPDVVASALTDAEKARR